MVRHSVQRQRNENATKRELQERIKTLEEENKTLKEKLEKHAPTPKPRTSLLKPVPKPRTKNLLLSPTEDLPPPPSDDFLSHEVERAEVINELEQEEAVQRGFNVAVTKRFKGTTTEYDVVLTYPCRDLENFFQDYKGYEKDLIEKQLKVKKAFKLNHALEADYKKIGTGETISYWYNKGRQ